MLAEREESVPINDDFDEPRLEWSELLPLGFSEDEIEADTDSEEEVLEVDFEESCFEVSELLVFDLSKVGSEDVAAFWPSTAVNPETDILFFDETGPGR